jgi:hypothetical protein
VAMLLEKGSEGAPDLVRGHRHRAVECMRELC